MHKPYLIKAKTCHLSAVKIGAFCAKVTIKCTLENILFLVIVLYQSIDGAQPL